MTRKAWNEISTLLFTWVGIGAVVLSTLSFGGCGRRAPIIEDQLPAHAIIDFVEDERADDYAVKSDPGARSSSNEDIAAKSEPDMPQVVGDWAPVLPEYLDKYHPIESGYKIAKGDILEVSIYGNQDMNSDVIIAPDGKLYYQFLDGVEAEGKTVPEVTDMLAQRLGHLFVQPEINIIPKRKTSQNYFILGKVAQPGIYPITTNMTIRQAIGAAGGITLGGYAGTTIATANLRGSFIVRDGKRLDIDFDRLLEKTDVAYAEAQDIFLRPGDYIYIASSLIQNVYLLGDVREPKPIPYKDNLTLTAVLAGVSGTTEGWTDRAFIRNVLIVRGSLDNPKTYSVDVLAILHGQARDIFVLPGDIIYVQPKNFSFGREVVRAAVDSFFNSFAGTSGTYYGKEWFK